MKQLHINLKAEWFDMIASGEKKVEYRELTNYWLKRLYGTYLVNSVTNEKENKENVYSTLSMNSDLWNGGQNHLPFDYVIFSNGYSIIRRMMWVELKRITISKGDPAKGAIKDRYYFCIELGEKR